MIIKAARHVTPAHKALALLASLILVLGTLLPTDQPPSPRILSTAGSSFADTVSQTQKADVRNPQNPTIWKVEPGDNLTYIFKKNDIPETELQNMMLADTQFLDLETLQPGMEIGLDFNDNGKFSRLILFRDPARRIIYTRQADGSYQHQSETENTYWVSEVHRGSIKGSFYQSAQQSGLNDAQIADISHLLSYQLNFRRDLRAGDRFNIVIAREMIGQQFTGKTKIEAISLKRRHQTHYAFQFKDHFYDRQGLSVTPAFLRWPTLKRYRISSPFNKNRLHPVTGRRAPHNGVDLATPVGTPIVSTGDGVIRRIGNHPFAGKYIDIDHGGTHTTRYLHLHRILVKRGARVKRGQKIALSGNTGRSTGPHLHYEFHIKGLPVDPVRAKIPTAASVKQQDRPLFTQQVEQQMAVLEHASDVSELLALKTEQ